MEPVNAKLFQDRTRTNILRGGEQRLISLLVKNVPSYITSNILTVIGLIGSFIVLAGFLLAKYADHSYLLLGIAGLVINWVGDSLDGRLAYYRNIPRKWYGFSLDIIMDWASIVLIGLGYIVYADGYAELYGFLFVVFYLWAMIISQIRYKITGYYAIDSGLLGPTELRVIICMILLAEVLFPGVINWFAAFISIVLFILNIADTRKLLKAGDALDLEERQKREQG
jgi:phosphatidylglycerophosphate synthase